jgi:hypothetical protein
MKLLVATLFATALGLSAAAAQQASAPIPPPGAVPPTAPTVAAAPHAKAPIHRRHHAMAQRQSPAAERRETQALNILEATGGGEVSDVHPYGRAYRATVNQNGTAQTVIVDPRSGDIRPAQ